MNELSPSEPRSHKQQFAVDVKTGLSGDLKFLPSKYFYDEMGSKLFQKIMHMPEYYLFESELEIFKKQSEQFLKAIFEEDDRPVEIIELGAGDGLKTKELLKELSRSDEPFSYLPIDISEEAINQISETLLSELPDLKISGIVAEYFEGLEQIRMSNSRKVILFLGSNLGNFRKPNAERFLKAINNRLDPGDLLILGTDLKKHPKTILAAYNDSQGITRDFNLNLLRRINKELNADFILDNFEHFAMYDPETGEARSYLVSLSEQEVSIGELNQTFKFDRWELIHTEISKKYSFKELASLAEASGFQVKSVICDSNMFFADSIWEKA